AADGRLDGMDAAGVPVATIGARAYDPGRQSLDLQAALAVVARRYADAAITEKLPAVTGLGVVGLPDSQGTAVPTAVRLGSSGLLHTLGASGADSVQLAADVYATHSASQRPPTALFIKRSSGEMFALGYNGSAGLLGNGTTIAGTATPI